MVKMYAQYCIRYSIGQMFMRFNSQHLLVIKVSVCMHLAAKRKWKIKWKNVKSVLQYFSECARSNHIWWEIRVAYKTASRHVCPSHILNGVAFSRCSDF